MGGAGHGRNGESELAHPGGCRTCRGNLVPGQPDVPFSPDQVLGIAVNDSGDLPRTGLGSSSQVGEPVTCSRAPQQQAVREHDQEANAGPLDRSDDAEHTQRPELGLGTPVGFREDGDVGRVHVTFGKPVDERRRVAGVHRSLDHRQRVDGLACRSTSRGAASQSRETVAPHEEISASSTAARSNSCEAASMSSPDGSSMIGRRYDASRRPRTLAAKVPIETSACSISRRRS